MPDPATARYVLQADDRTKAAIASARAGFKSLEGGIKGTVSRLNLIFGTLTGIGLKRAIREVFNETTKGNAEFAKAIDDVRSSARSLLVAKTDIAATASAYRQLATVLKDPDVIAAADAITSTLIRGFAGVAFGIAKTAGGISGFFKQIQDGYNSLPPALRKAIEEGTSTALNALPGVGLARQITRTIGLPESGPSDSRPNPVEAERLRARDARINAAGERVGRAFQVQRDFEDLSRWLQEHAKEVDEFQEGTARLSREVSEQLSRDQAKIANERIEDELEFREAMGWTWHQRLERERELAAARKELNRVGVMNFVEDWRNAFETWVQSGRRTAREFGKALLAELANRQLLKTLDLIFGDRKSGGGGLLGSLIGQIAGFFTGGGSAPVRTRGPLAAGGQFSAGDMRMVGERGPELAVFGKGGFMVPNHALGGGTVVNLSIHNDNRGASVELIRKLPEHDRRLAEQIEARVIEGFQRRRYDLG